MRTNMPRQRKSTYLPPGFRGASPAGSSSTPASHGSPLVGYDIGGSSSQSQVPETPPAYTAHAPGDYPSDGCPYLTLTDGATFQGKPVLFPNGRNKFWPLDASDKLGKIFSGGREMPGQGGEKWSNVPDRMKHFYFDELRSEVERRMDERMIDGHELSIEERDQIFFEVNPMDSKGRMYGLGSLGPSMSSGSFSVSQGSGSRSNLYTQQQVNEMMTHLQQEIAATKAAYEQVLEKQARMAQRMDALTQMFSSSSQSHPPPPPDYS